MSETKRRVSGFFWVYAIVFFMDAVGFIVADYNNDMQKMVWCGFMGMLWFKLAEREAAE